MKRLKQEEGKLTMEPGDERIYRRICAEEEWEHFSHLPEGLVIFHKLYEVMAELRELGRAVKRIEEQLKR